MEQRTPRCTSVNDPEGHDYVSMMLSYNDLGRDCETLVCESCGQQKICCHEVWLKNANQAWIDWPGDIQDLHIATCESENDLTGHNFTEMIYEQYVGRGFPTTTKRGAFCNHCQKKSSAMTCDWKFCSIYFRDVPHYSCPCCKYTERACGHKHR